MNFNYILTQFNFIAIFQGFLLAIALLVIKKGEPSLNKILGIMLLTFSWSGVYYTIDSMGKMGSYLPLAYTNSLSDYLYNPLVYLYVVRLTVKDAKFTKKSLLHFIPAFFMLVYYANYFFASRHVKQEIFNRGYNYFPYDVAVFAYVNLVQMIVYIIISAIILNRYGKQINQLYSNFNKRNHNWLKFILIINFLSAIVCFFLFRSSYAGVGQIISVLSALLIYVIGYKMLSDPPRLPEVELQLQEATVILSQINENDEPGSVKYERSGLGEQKAKALYEKLKQVMEAEKQWLDAELNLKQLADKLNCQPHHLSQVINQHFGKNFYDFINTYRVDEVKRRIKAEKYKHLTLLAIAFDCGFNSKAAFNNVFKKRTGMSPSDYKKEHITAEAEMI